MRIRLLADDLTGAMDSAVRFVPLAGAIPVAWQHGAVAGETGSLAFDLATRELGAAEARRRAASAASLLPGADIAYLKCDSLLRGWAAEEIAGCLSTGAFAHCVIAPAFPAQRRVTRAGRQWAGALDDSDWHQVGPALADGLAAHGISIARQSPGEPAAHGVSLWDAETNADLVRIAAAGRALPSPVLWCGTAGLAEALVGVPPTRTAEVHTPFLALVGSNHPMALRQVAEAVAWHHLIPADDPAAHARIAEHLQQHRAAVVSVALPDETARPDAADQIARVFDHIVTNLAPPATLFAAGGETLRAICTALGTTILVVESEITDGVPVSRMRDGRWAGTPGCLEIGRVR